MLTSYLFTARRSIGFIPRKTISTLLYIRPVVREENLGRAPEYKFSASKQKAVSLPLFLCSFLPFVHPPFFPSSAPPSLPPIPPFLLSSPPHPPHALLSHPSSSPLLPTPLPPFALPSLSHASLNNKSRHF